MSGPVRFARFERTPRHVIPPPEVNIRPGSVEDAEQLGQLEQERQGAPVQELAERFSAGLRVARSDRLMLVATVQRDVVGWGQVVRVRLPPEAPANHAPEGWYLSSLLVGSAWRRLGIGAALTRERLAWVSTRAAQAYYFANSLKPGQHRAPQEVLLRRADSRLLVPRHHLYSGR